MTYPIINNIIPGLPRKAYRYGASAYEGVVAHATAVNAPDENQVKYYTREWQKAKAFVHFFVDWDSIRQTADTDYRGWGAGNGNPRYVHVELCETDNREEFLESYKRYVWLLAYILKKKNLGVTDEVTLVSHDWVTKNLGGTTHSDPIGYLKKWGLTWGQLVKDVRAAYDGDSPVVAAQAQKVPPTAVKPADSNTKHPIPAGVLKLGSDRGLVRALQTVLDTHSPRFNPGAVDGLYGDKTKDAVKRYQMYYGVKPYDGIYGPKTAAQLKLTYK